MPIKPRSRELPVQVGVWHCPDATVKTSRGLESGLLTAERWRNVRICLTQMSPVRRPSRKRGLQLNEYSYVIESQHCWSVENRRARSGKRPMREGVNNESFGVSLSPILGGALRVLLCRHFVIFCLVSHSAASHLFLRSSGVSLCSRKSYEGFIGSRENQTVSRTFSYCHFNSVGESKDLTDVY